MKNVWRSLALFSLLSLTATALLLARPSHVSGKKLYAKVAERENVSPQVVEKILHTFWATVQEELKAGRTVQIRGFGTFYLSHRKARQWTHPKTQKVFQVPERRTVHFRPSGKLKKFLNP